MLINTLRVWVVTDMVESTQIREKYSEGESIDAIPIRIFERTQNGKLELAIIQLGWDDEDIEIRVERIGKAYILRIFDNAPVECTIEGEDMYLVKELKKYLKSRSGIALIDWLRDVIEYIRSYSDRCEAGRGP